MDTLNKVLSNSEQTDPNSENVMHNVMHNIITESDWKPCGENENMKTSVKESVGHKESVEILSVELVTHGTESENTEPLKEITSVDNQSTVNNKMESTKVSEELQQPQEKEVLMTIENKEVTAEAEESVGHKEPVEILSVELVTPGTESENTEPLKEIASVDNQSTVNKMESSKVSEELQQSQEKEVSMIKENKEVTAEADCKNTSVDVNMECATDMVTTTTNSINSDDFSLQSTTILAVIENIQSSVNKEDTTTSNMGSNASDLTSLSSTIPSGLSLLAQYDSDNEDSFSDSDSVIEVPSTSAKDYRNQVVEINSDSDSDDSDSDVEYLSEIRKTIEKRIEVADEDDEDEDDDNEESVGKKKHKPKLKVKGEMLLEDLPPIQDLQITVAEEECIEFGKIHSIVDQLLLVSALPNAILLDLETVIFLERGHKVLGTVFDVLGQVADPLYCVRFNSNKEIKEKEINVGDVVYVAPKTQYTQYVILSSLMKLKGSDASWENDIEPPPRFLDYSDDEQEQLAKRKQRNKDRPTDNNDDLSKRPRASEGDPSENLTTNRCYTPHHSNRYSQQRDDLRGGGGSNYNSYSRPRYNNPNIHQRQQQQQQHPNYNRNSWHSNYYPQQYQGLTPANYGYGPNTRAQSQNQHPPPQTYPSHVSMYGMPPMHTMPFPPPAPYGNQVGVQHMPPHQLMPNSFSIRPPTIHGIPPQQQYTSPPPPPGAQ